MKRLILLLSALSAVCLIAAAQPLPQGPRKVSIENNGKQWNLVVDGKPFYVHGASAYFSQPFYGMLPNYGANTVRFFSIPDSDGQKLLDNCAKIGLLVHAGLGFKSIRSGYYDADEQDAIARQEQKIISIVQKYKDHPAILCWSIGNEFEIGHASEPLTAQWESIERIAARIHEIDPNHPVTLAVVDGFPPAKIEGMKNIAKSLDFVSVNGYLNKDGVTKVPEALRYIGWNKPYMSTELGPEGWWLHENFKENRYTDWHCVIDYTSTEKESRYEYIMRKLYDDPACIGVLTFLWGNQTGARDEVLEWYGLVDVNGYTYGAVDVMQRFWTGHTPAALAPRIETREDITMNGRHATDWIHVEPNSKNKAAAVVDNRSGAPLRYHWRIVAERSRRIDNKFADGISGLIANDGGLKINFNAPARPGAYRLYLHVYDDVNRKAAYASIPFFVDGEAAQLNDLGGRP